MFHFTRSSLCSYVFTTQYLDVIRDGFPHSEIPGSKVAWDLTETYRTLQRPSSSDSVKASTVRSWSALQKHTIVFVSFAFLCNLWIIIIYRNDKFSTYSWIYFLTWVNCKVHSFYNFLTFLIMSYTHIIYVQNHEIKWERKFLKKKNRL